MEDDRNCGLKISVENVNSEDDGSSSAASSGSGAEEEETSVRGKKVDRSSPSAALERQSSTDEGRSADEDSDPNTISVLAVDSTERPKPTEPVTYFLFLGMLLNHCNFFSEILNNRSKLNQTRRSFDSFHSSDNSTCNN